jgi:hypothetical protein
MKRILVLGAGQSTPYLTHHLLALAEEHDWHVTVGDLDRDLAQQRVGDHSRGTAIRFDVNDEQVRSKQIKRADVVINMLAARFQDLVAWDCVTHGKHMLGPWHRSHVGDVGDRRRACARWQDLAVPLLRQRYTGAESGTQPVAVCHHLEPAQCGDGERARRPVHGE